MVNDTLILELISLDYECSRLSKQLQCSYLNKAQSFAGIPTLDNGATRRASVPRLPVVDERAKRVGYSRPPRPPIRCHCRQSKASLSAAPTAAPRTVCEAVTTARAML